MTSRRDGKPAAHFYTEEKKSPCIQSYGSPIRLVVLPYLPPLAHVARQWALQMSKVLKNTSRALERGGNRERARPHPY